MKIEKQKLNYLRLALVCIGIGLLFGTLITYGVTPSSNFTLSPGVYPGAASYTIWREYSNYFAKDANGLIVYSGTDASSAIQSAINSLGTVGGKIYIKSGIYLIDTSIDLTGKKGITISGESVVWSHILADSGTVLRLTASIQAVFKCLEPTGERNHVNGFVFENLQIDGNRRNGITDGSGIWLWNTSAVLIKNCFIHSCAGDAGIFAENSFDLRIEDCSIGGSDGSGLPIEHVNASIISGEWFPNQQGIHLNGGFQMWIARCGIWHNKLNGLCIESSDISSTNAIETIYLDSNTIVWNDGNGILLVRNYAKTFWYITLLHTVADENGLNGFYALNNVASNWVLRIHIMGCRFCSNDRLDTTNYGIKFDGNGYKIVGIDISDCTAIQDWNTQGSMLLDNVEDVIFTGNSFSSAWTIVNSEGASIIRKGNMIDLKPTENSGSATGSTGITVSHGLAGTPTCITVTPTADAGDVYVTNIGSTTFQIAFDGGGSATFYWYAEYTP